MECLTKVISPLKSKTNLLVNAPLIILAITQTLKDPEVFGSSPIPQSSMKWILWILAIIGLYLRNRASNRAVSTQITDEACLNCAPDVVLKETAYADRSIPNDTVQP